MPAVDSPNSPELRECAFQPGSLGTGERARHTVDGGGWRCMTARLAVPWGSPAASLVS